MDIVSYLRFASGLVNAEGRQRAMQAMAAIINFLIAFLFMLHLHFLSFVAHHCADTEQGFFGGRI